MCVCLCASVCVCLCVISFNFNSSEISGLDPIVTNNNDINQNVLQTLHSGTGYG